MLSIYRMASQSIISVNWGSIMGVNDHAVDRSDKEFAEADLLVRTRV